MKLRLKKQVLNEKYNLLVPAGVELNAFRDVNGRIFAAHPNNTNIYTRVAKTNIVIIRELDVKEPETVKDLLDKISRIEKTYGSESSTYMRVSTQNLIKIVGIQQNEIESLKSTVQSLHNFASGSIR
jgi:hypothetical protein